MHFGLVAGYQPVGLFEGGHLENPLQQGNSQNLGLAEWVGRGATVATTRARDALSGIRPSNSEVSVICWATLLVIGRHLQRRIKGRASIILLRAGLTTLPFQLRIEVNKSLPAARREHTD